MARLDRLGPAKGVAQVGATIGRQFAYELLQAVSPLDEETLQRELGRLVDAELVYQTRHTATGYLPVQACPHPGRGVSVAAQEHTAAVPPADCAGVGGTVSRYCWRHSLSCWRITTRKQAVTNRPWPTGSGLASVRCERSAYVEAISHLTKGLEVLSHPARHSRAHPGKSSTLQIRPGGQALNGH